MSPSCSPEGGWGSVCWWPGFLLRVHLWTWSCHYVASRGQNCPEHDNGAHGVKLDACLHPPCLTLSATSGTGNCHGPGSTTGWPGHFPLLSRGAELCLCVCVCTYVCIVCMCTHTCWPFFKCWGETFWIHCQCGLGLDLVGRFYPKDRIIRCHCWMGQLIMRLRTPRPWTKSISKVSRGAWSSARTQAPWLLFWGF